MAQYTVPKFIEHKVKIVGPLTLQQFMFVGGAGAVCFILYLILPFFFFILASLVIMVVGAGLAFGKVGGRSLPVVLKNFLSFSMEPKIYLWKKKAGMPPKFREKVVRPEIKKPEGSPVPTVVGKSKLRDLSTHVETGMK